MNITKIVAPADATGLVQEHYERIRNARTGETNRMVLSWSTQPQVAEDWLVHRTSARAAVPIDDVLFEILLCRVQYVLRCRYVLANHAFVLANVSGFTHERITGLIRDPYGSDLDERAKAVIRFGERLATDSSSTTRADVDALLAHGFSEEDVVGLIFLCGYAVSNAVVCNGLGPDLDGFSAEYHDIADW